MSCQGGLGTRRGLEESLQECNDLDSCTGVYSDCCEPSGCGSFETNRFKLCTDIFASTTPYNDQGCLYEKVWKGTNFMTSKLLYYVLQISNGTRNVICVDRM